MPSLREQGSSFEWRVGTGYWRWLLLGSVGVAASACWGKADEEPGEPNVEPGTLTSAGGSSGHTTSTPTSEPCPGPTPLGGGWESCANGLTHRAAITSECASSLPRAEGVDLEVVRRIYPNYVEGSGGAGGSGDDYATPFYGPACLRDSDCTLHPSGHCDAGSYAEGTPAVFCQYGCVTDADCGANMVCVCGSPVGQCMPSSCSTDADCNGEAMCANFEASPGCSSVQFACQTRRDTCATEADCPSGQACTSEPYTNDGARQCAERTYVCGRPFLIDGAARLAGARERADWYCAVAGSQAAPSAALALSDPELRGAVAQGWLDQALMEHASVAAFARFSLQLLSLGAPAELLAECGRALQDEIGHARACFSLARRHTERDLGPGPLPLAGALDEQDLRSIVLGTIAEGCIGETLAALEAAEARAHCTDPAACAVLERISADETRHAELAWRFVAWALETGPASLRADVQGAFAGELAAAEANAPVGVSGFEQRLLCQGLMGAGLRAALRERALREVIAPCAAALLGGLPEQALGRSGPEGSPGLAGPGVLTGAAPLC